MKITVAFVVFQRRVQLNFTEFVPPVSDVVTTDVPRCGSGEPTLFEVVTNLLVVPDAGDRGRLSPQSDRIHDRLY